VPSHGHCPGLWPKSSRSPNPNPSPNPNSSSIPIPIPRGAQGHRLTLLTLAMTSAKARATAVSPPTWEAADTALAKALTLPPTELSTACTWALAWGGTGGRRNCKPGGGARGRGRGKGRGPFARGGAFKRRASCPTVEQDGSQTEPHQRCGVHVASVWPLVKVGETGKAGEGGGRRGTNSAAEEAGKEAEHRYQVKCNRLVALPGGTAVSSSALPALLGPPAAAAAAGFEGWLHVVGWEQGRPMRHNTTLGAACRLLGDWVPPLPQLPLRPAVPRLQAQREGRVRCKQGVLWTKVCCLLALGAPMVVPPAARPQPQPPQLSSAPNP